MAQIDAPDDTALSAALVRNGFSKREADLLIAFVPLAFSRPVLEDLGVAHFAETVSAQTAKGTWIEVPLTSQPIYVAALEIAREHRRAGLIRNEAFKVIALRSEQLSAASNALNAGADLKGASIASAFVRLPAEELGYIS